ncbi:MAG: hypothetical protein WCV81_03655 [Microgenomates group bacterium]|jgi:hypothetical protein
MNKISINLLPQTVLLERIQSSKLSLVNKLSVGVLVAIILVTSGVFILRINQNQQNSQVAEKVKEAEAKVKTFSTKESEAFALKNRMDSISSKIGSDDKVKQMFNLIVYLTPADVNLYDASIDKNGVVTASFTSTSLASIDKLFTSLSNTETNFKLVKSVDLNGISLGKDSTYRFSLRVVD